ncbi:hypothetical protein I5W30_08800 [Stenotrophomonas maltophilia]|nr:hypothetical protein [Stenotrophomonas maltophilia]
MNRPVLGKVEWSVGIGIAVVVLGGLVWSTWGYSSWKIASAKSAIMEKAGVTVAIFDDVRLGSDKRTVCGRVSVGQDGYRRFMVDAVAPVIDPGVDDGSTDAILWRDYPRKCMAS